MSAILTVTDRERDLAERLRVAEQQRDELAAQVEGMRSALAGAAEYTALLDDFTQAAMRDALAMPPSAAAILRQRDARMLREAAGICAGMFDGQVGAVHVASMRCHDALVAEAAELERKNG